jgi:TorA maturation chaperone TorD
MTRVLLVSQFPLFSEGLHKLLACEDQIEIVAEEEDATRAMERFKALQPDVVIVDSESPTGDLAALSLRILKEGKQVRVIGLSLRENAVYVYRKERIIAHRVEDLMNAIESDLPVSDLASPAELSALAAARSRVYGFLGGVYNRLPDEQFAASLASPELAVFLSSLGDAEDTPEDMREGLRLIQAFIRASQDKPIEELKTDLAVERTKLVRGIKPGYGPPPPYEGVYAATAEEALGHAVLNIKNIYAESGVVLPEEVHDQPDFIGFELDFMRHLAEREAQAWADDKMEEVILVTKKEQAFLVEHILAWIPRFCDLMFEQAQLDFYRGIARLTKGFVESEAHTVAELVNQVQAVQTA